MRIVTFLVLLLFTSFVFAEESIELGTFHSVDWVSANASYDELLRVFNEAKEESPDGRVFFSTRIVFASRSEMTNACSELLAQGVTSGATRVSTDESEKLGHACYVFHQLATDDYSSVREVVSVINEVASQFLGQYTTLGFLVPSDYSKSDSNT